MTISSNAVTKEVARIIWPEALDGETENGRLDEAKALDTAEEVIGEVMEHASWFSKAQFSNAMDDHRLISLEALSDLRTCLNEGDTEGALELLDGRLTEPNEVIDALEFTFED